ncbi:MAG: flavin reductase family protein [Desulfobacteraceae bacterium]|nr:flavin reductase family protein [Desulfobacteraceae bacterium]
MKKLGPVNALYPMPCTLVGAIVEGRPNFITVAHVGILNSGKPQYLSIGLNKAHYTNAGIKANGAFSICLPPESLIVETDYCGIVSGKTKDKASLFDVFYGTLETAPMIRQCPVCMECSLDRILNFESHDIFIGQLVETYAEDSVLTEGAIDISKVKPLLFDMASRKYFSLGQSLGNCWSIGKGLKR